MHSPFTFLHPKKGEKYKERNAQYDNVRERYLDLQQQIDAVRCLAKQHHYQLQLSIDPEPQAIDKILQRQAPVNPYLIRHQQLRDRDRSATVPSAPKTKHIEPKDKSMHASTAQRAYRATPYLGRTVDAATVSGKPLQNLYAAQPTHHNQAQSISAATSQALPLNVENPPDLDEEIKLLIQKIAEKKEHIAQQEALLKRQK